MKLKGGGKPEVRVHAGATEAEEQGSLHLPSRPIWADRGDPWERTWAVVETVVRKAPLDFTVMVSRTIVNAEVETNAVEEMEGARGIPLAPHVVMMAAENHRHPQNHHVQGVVADPNPPNRPVVAVVDAAGVENPLHLPQLAVVGAAAVDP